MDKTSIIFLEVEDFIFMVLKGTYRNCWKFCPLSFVGNREKERQVGGSRNDPIWPEQSRAMHLKVWRQWTNTPNMLLSSHHSAILVNPNYHHPFLYNLLFLFFPLFILLLHPFSHLQKPRNKDLRSCMAFPCCQPFAPLHIATNQWSPTLISDQFRHNNNKINKCFPPLLCIKERQRNRKWCNWYLVMMLLSKRKWDENEGRGLTLDPRFKTKAIDSP